VIDNNSTNINKTNNLPLTSNYPGIHLKMTTTYDVGNPGSGLRQAHNVAKLNRLMGSQRFPS